MTDQPDEHLDLEALRLFTFIAREGSLQRAAAAAGCSRTTLRRKLEKVEAIVGAPVVRRSRDGVELTEAGRILAQHCEELLGGLSRVLRTTREVALDPARPIRFLVDLGLPPLVFDVVFRGVRQLWSDAQVRFRVTDRWSPNELSQHDLVLVVGDVTPPGSFDVVQFPDVDVVLFASPDYLAHHPPIGSPADLASHALLVWDAPLTGVPDRLPCRTGPDLPVSPAFVTNDQHALHEMASRGAGVVYAGHRVFGPDDEQRYRPVLPDDIGTTMQVRLFVARAVADSPRVKKLIEIARLVAGASP